MHKRIRAAAVAMAALQIGGAFAARAADMSMAPLYQPEASPMVEFGSGWYLRGDLGYSSISAPTMSSGALIVTQTATPFTTTTTPFGGLSNFGRQSLGDYMGGAGVGYQFNRWFRTDLTVDYHQSFTNNVTSAYKPGCYMTSPTAPFAPVTAPCSRTDSEGYRSWTGLLNLYGDLGTWYGATPYVGGGFGLSNIQTSASESWFWGNGGGAVANYTIPGTAPTPTSTYRYGYAAGGPSQNLTDFSWALMAGLSYEFTPHLKFDIGYRYLNMGTVTAVNASGQTVRSAITAQEVRAGLRFTPDL